MVHENIGRHGLAVDVYGVRAGPGSMYVQKCDMTTEMDWQKTGCW